MNKIATAQMTQVPVERLIPYINSVRTHSLEQIKKLRASLRESGFVNPILIDHEYNVIAGHGACNVWRLARIAKVDDGFMHEYYITALGETEMALKVKYEATQGQTIPFFGGYTHSWEIVNEGAFLAALNEEYVDITQYTAATGFETLNFWSVSALYHPSTGDALGGHGAHWRFTEHGLGLEQSVSFTGAYTMIESNMPMCAPSWRSIIILWGTTAAACGITAWRTPSGSSLRITARRRFTD